MIRQIFNNRAETSFLILSLKVIACLGSWSAWPITRYLSLMDAKLKRLHLHFSVVRNFCESIRTLKPIQSSESGRKSRDRVQNEDREFSQRAGLLRKENPVLLLRSTRDISRKPPRSPITFLDLLSSIMNLLEFQRYSSSKISSFSAMIFRVPQSLTD
jgi:hypothetical protein